MIILVLVSATVNEISQPVKRSTADLVEIRNVVVGE